MERLRGPVQRFAGRLFQACRTEYPDGNLLFSPFTASTALLLIYMGSDGITKRELETVLELEEILAKQPTEAENDVETLFRQAIAVMSKLPGAKDEKEVEDYGAFRVFRVNKLFINSRFDVKNDFLLRTSKMRSNTTPLDFAADPEACLKQINDYVEEKMNGKVENCFTKDEIDENTAMVLVNGVCFRARWNIVFNPEYSGTFQFKNDNGAHVQHAMMRGVFNVPYVDDKTLGITYVEVPYAFNKASLLIFLPHGDTSLKEASKKINAVTTNKLNMTKRMKEIDLTLPIIEMNSNLDLKRIIRKMGVQTLFSDDSDLTRMSDDHIPLTVARHSGYFSMDETGTEAGSSVPHPVLTRRQSLKSSLSDTAHENLGSTRSLQMLRRTSSGVPQEAGVYAQMVVNRPFFFGVRHNKSGIMVCLGRIYELASSERKASLPG